MTLKGLTAGVFALGLSGAAMADVTPQAGPAGAASSTAPTVSAAKPPAAQEQEAGSAFAANRITGRIKAVDQTTHTLTIDEKGKPESVKFGDSATIFLDGRLGSIDDLQEGQDVRAAYEERDGQKNLRWLDITAQQAPLPSMPAPTVPAPGTAKP